MTQKKTGSKKKNQIIDIDAAVSAFEPSIVRFRGDEYTLGKSVLGLIAVSELYQEKRPEGETEIAFALRMVRPAIKALSPPIYEVIEAEDLSAAEEVAVLKPLTEVVKRFGAITF